MVDFLLCLGRRNKRVDGDDQGRRPKPPQQRSAVVRSIGRPISEEEEEAAVEQSGTSDVCPVMYVSDGASFLLHQPPPAAAELGESDRGRRDSAAAAASAQRPLLLRLTVMTVDGATWEVRVDPDFTVDKLKQMVLGHFHSPSKTIKAAARYRLVTTASPETRLNDEFTLLQEGVKNNDELILLKKTVDAQSQLLAKESHQLRDVVSKAPSEATIKSLTTNVSVKNADRIATDTVTVVDFQVELRKTLVSLIDVAQKIQLYNSTNLLTHMRHLQVEDVGRGFMKHLVDPSALKQLTDMGFSVSKATEALQQKQMSAVDALEQLLQKQGQDEDDDDDEIDDGESEFRSSRTSEDGSNEPSPSSESRVTDSGVTPSSSTISDSREDETPSSTSSGAAVTSAAPESANRLLSLQQLMHAFRAYKRREFRPNMKAFHSLCDMGFDQDKIMDALRVSGNKHDAAFEWLLSRWLTDDDLRSSLDPEGPVYSAIMANPIIQLGLNSPKILYAFLHMLENPNCANHWLNDPDTAPLLNQIFKIYHLEKYSLQMKGKTVPST